MTWINFLINNQIKHYIHKIKKGDSIILKPSNQIIIILSGVSYIGEIFINKENSPITILGENDIFIINDKNKRLYYKIIALKTTYILRLNNKITKKKKVQLEINKNISEHYLNTFENYQIIKKIMQQKSVSNRINQLLLLLFLKFGQIKGNNILIPFQLSHKDIAILTGTSTNTVTKTINTMSKNGTMRKIYKNVILINNIIYLNLE